MKECKKISSRFSKLEEPGAKGSKTLKACFRGIGPSAIHVVLNWDAGLHSQHPED
jgi:hypothetical protein